MFMKPRIHKVIDLLELTYGPNYTFKNVCDLTETLRRKPLRIESDTMPLWITGYCLPLADVDLVCYRDRGDRFMNLPPQLHEVSHLLLGHLGQPDGMPKYKAFIKARTHQQSVLSGVSSSDPRVNEPGELAKLLVGGLKCRGMHFKDPNECDAETLATWLMGTILVSETSMPLVARELYGA